MIETPPLLLGIDEQEYIEKAELEFANPIILPENKKVLSFYQGEDFKHLWRGRDFSCPPNTFRMHRILWVKFVLQNKDIREVKKRLCDGNVVFFCRELMYLVVCDELKRGDLKLITQYCGNAKFPKEFNDPTIYETYNF
jgi:hypothetical protein